MENSLKIHFTYALKDLLGQSPLCSQVYNYTDHGSPQYQKAQQTLWDKPGSGSRQPSCTSGSRYLEAAPIDRQGFLYNLTEVDTRKTYLEAMNRNFRSIDRTPIINTGDTPTFTLEQAKQMIASFESDMDKKCGPTYDFYQYSKPCPQNQPLQKYQQMKI